MSATALAWLWAEVAPHTDLTLLAAPFVVAGYRLGRRASPWAWLFMGISNALLLATAIQSIFTPHWHLGLLVSAYLIVEAPRNFVALRRREAARRLATAA